MKANHNLLCQHNECTGCGACENICPTNAIRMRLDNEGFQRPVITKDCKQCGLCFSVCPIANPPRLQRFSKPVAYAVWNKDRKIRKISASGGAFGVFADGVLDHGGVVFGASYNQNFSVSVKKVFTPEALEPLRNSKYVQSFTADSYREVREYLKTNRQVLYAALPCQIAGLYGFLGGDHNHLFTIDLVCHGVPSVTLFQSYLKYMEKELHSSVVAINHRSHLKWSPLTPYRVEIKTADGKTHYRMPHEDYYVNGFLSSLTLRPSCYLCPFSSFPRIGDITIGDFFGLGTIKPFIQKGDTGVSQMLVNSVKGCSAVEKNLFRVFCEKRDLFECVVYNTNLWKPSPKNPSREAFFHDFQTKPFESLLRPYLGKSFNGKMRRIIRNIVMVLAGHTISAKISFLKRKWSGTFRQIERRLGLDK